MEAHADRRDQLLKMHEGWGILDSKCTIRVRHHQMLVLLSYDLTEIPVEDRVMAALSFIELVHYSGHLKDANLIRSEVDTQGDFTARYIFPSGYDLTSLHDILRSNYNVPEGLERV